MARKKSLIDQAAEFAESVLPQIEAAVETAKEKYDEAMAAAAPVLADGKSLAAEKAKEAAAAASAKLSAAGMPGGDAAESEPTPKRRGRLRKLLVLLGLAAVAGFVVKRLVGQSSSDNWQSAYTPNPAAAEVTPEPVADVAEEPVADSDDEPVADAAEAAGEAEADATAEPVADATDAEGEAEAADPTAETTPKA